MNISPIQTSDTPRYARVVAASKRARWDIDTVIRDRALDGASKFLPDSLSFVKNLPFLTRTEHVFFSRVQGRTYANMFGLVERFVNAKVLEISQRHFFGDQVALESLVRFSDEELKHQELFRRVEVLAERAMPEGYRFALDANAVAGVVLGKPTWAVLALILLVELVTQVHYKQSIAPDDELSELFKDVFRFHWMEESQHALLDEIEWITEDRRLDSSQRADAVTALIDLVGAVDGLLEVQSRADADYFVARAGRAFGADERDAICVTFLKAYREQYILSGARDTRFPDVLQGLLDLGQFERVVAALGALM